jgi:putative FmdB family regulatory protein
VCNACEHAFEEFQAITAKPLSKCPKCKKSKLRRVIGPGAALLFKGSGFYLTDYRSEGYKKAAKADQESQKKPPESTSSKNPDAKT